MTADEFVEKLGDKAPSMEHLLSRGYIPDIAEEIRGSFFLRRKPPEIPEIDDPLEILVCTYDTSVLEIGMVVLGRNKVCIPPGPDKILVGEIEADPIVIDKESGVVELLDHSRPDYVIAQCAISGERFLEALLLFASYEAPYLEFSGNMTRAQSIANNVAAHERAIKCAEAAGISTPPNIYEMLLGCDSRLL